MVPGHPELNVEKKKCLKTSRLGIKASLQAQKLR